MEMMSTQQRNEDLPSAVRILNQCQVGDSSCLTHILCSPASELVEFYSSAQRIITTNRSILPPPLVLSFQSCAVSFTPGLLRVDLCTESKEFQSPLRSPGPPARASSHGHLCVIIHLRVNLPVVLLAMVFSPKAMCSCTTAPFARTIE